MKRYLDVDVVVVGAGPAGVAAALASRRNGAKTLLISEQAFLGGLLTSGLPLLGFFDKYEKRIVCGIAEEMIERLQKIGGSLGHTTREPVMNSITPIDPFLVRFVLLEMMEEAGVEILWPARAVDALEEGHEIRGVVIETKEGRQIVTAKVVIDCSGDGDIAAKAGASFTVGRADDGLIQSATLVFSLDGIDFNELKRYLRENPSEIRTPLECLDEPGYAVVGLWNLARIAAEKGDFPLPHTRILMSILPNGNRVAVNTTRVDNPNLLTAAGFAELIRGLHQQVMPLHNFFRKYVPGFQNCYLGYVGDPVGIRESRHIIGDYQLTEQDVFNGNTFKDVIARGGYDIDLHHPGLKERFPGRHDKTEPYDIPYRCLVPTGIENVLVAGRCISATHEAAGSIRVMATCMATGEAAGVAAALAVQKSVSPRKVEIALIQKALIAQKAELGPAIKEKISCIKVEGGMAAN